MLENGAIPCSPAGSSVGAGVYDPFATRGPPSRAVPRSSLEGGRNSNLVGVERFWLETDLVRRPRVRGTAPLATVGNERRLSGRKKNAASRPAVTSALDVGPLKMDEAS